MLADDDSSESALFTLRNLRRLATSSSVKTRSPFDGMRSDDTETRKILFPTCLVSLNLSVSLVFPDETEIEQPNPEKVSRSLPILQYNFCVWISTLLVLVEGAGRRLVARALEAVRASPREEGPPAARAHHRLVVLPTHLLPAEKKVNKTLTQCPDICDAADDIQTVFWHVSTGESACGHEAKG